ncbi:hypothetical protein Droror1_Dr00024092, partial [Drosera rotundifolia]
MGKPTEERPLGADGLLIKHIQEQFKETSTKSESVFYGVSDVAILKFMVEPCVTNVKSDWKSIFMVFTAAAADEHESVVSLAFEIMEKIVREYFPYITKTESTTFTDCVNDFPDSVMRLRDQRCDFEKVSGMNIKCDKSSVFVV